MSINSISDEPLETICIPKSEYEALLQASKILAALYAGGVDNWEWFGEALAGMESE